MSSRVQIRIRSAKRPWTKIKFTSPILYAENDNNETQFYGSMKFVVLRYENVIWSTCLIVNVKSLRRFAMDFVGEQSQYSYTFNKAHATTQYCFKVHPFISFVDFYAFLSLNWLCNLFVAESFFNDFALYFAMENNHIPW